jgi:hypothetical protein
MTRLARFALLCLASVAALVAAGCGNKEDVVTVAETEGIYVTVDDLKYQIQISRILNPASPEDQAYLRGVSETDAELAEDEVWYGIFMRVENDTDEPHQMAQTYSIRDTQDNVFEPLDLDPAQNLYAYEARELGPGGALAPELNSPASDNTIRGNLLLFKIPASSLGNRPLELEIESPSGGDNGIIDIDV